MLRTKVQQRGPHPLGTWLNMVIAAQGGADRVSIERMEAIMHALRAYQQHPHARVARPRAVAATCGSVRLLDCGGDGPPVLFVPSLVNPSHILDLDKGRSLVRGMRKAGVHCYLLDWGMPDDEERGFDIDAYVTRRLLPLIKHFNQPVALVGYCLGGTLCVAAAALLPAAIRALVTLAAPWSFSAYPAQQRQALAAFWGAVRPMAGPLGVLPMEMLQPAFWSLDPEGMAEKFLRFARLPPDSLAAQRFVMLEDWANSGPPLALPAAEQCFDRFFGCDEPGRMLWQIERTRIAPHSYSGPSLVVAASMDKLVPADVSAQLAQTLPLADQLTLGMGHVGMIIGSSAKSQLWAPMRHWLRRHVASDCVAAPVSQRKLARSAKP